MAVCYNRGAWGFKQSPRAADRGQDLIPGVPCVWLPVTVTPMGDRRYTLAYL
jgi:hypothetical protein